MAQGIYHCHSIFSYDGRKNLYEIADWAMENKFSFVILTEHDDGFSQTLFDELIVQCRKVKDVILVPGIEYSFELNGLPVHIGVIGIEQFIDLKRYPQEICCFLELVAKNGGITILHHPFRVLELLGDEVLRKLDFVEAWNLVHDLKYAPNDGVINAARSMGFKGKFLASNDVHYFKKTDNSVFLKFLSGEECQNEEEIIQALKDGNYQINSENWKISANGDLCATRNYLTSLSRISLFHQKSYEKARAVYYKKINIPPPKWMVKLIK